MEVEYTSAHAEFHDGKVRIMFEDRVLFDGNARDGLVVHGVLQHLLKEMRPDMGAEVIALASEEDAEKMACSLQCADDAGRVQ